MIPMIIVDMVFHIKLFGVIPKWMIAIIMLAYYYGLYFVFNHKKNIWMFANNIETNVKIKSGENCFIYGYMLFCRF